jgi:hypothetical protein
MKPYARGIQDFKSGNISNPYNEGTYRSKDWELGFNRAYFENLEKVKRNERKYKKGSKKKG